MTPVDQEHFRNKATDTYGDCARATLASLLDLPLHGVPHFLQQLMDAGDEASSFHERIDDWLALRDLELLWFPRPQENRKGQYCYMSGPSPRGEGMYHAVVGLDGKVVHDPHPSRAGLLDNERWNCAYLIPRGSV